MTHLRVDTDFDALASFISDGVALLSSEGLVIGWSAGAAGVTGIPSIEAMEKPLDKLFARVDPPLGFAIVPQPTVLSTNDEHRRTIHANVMTIEEGWLVSFGPQRTFSAIEQLKSEIVTAVSHELKTPIATIKAFAMTMRENPDAPTLDRNDFLATIEEQADRLSLAVDELLLAGRVDAEHLLTHRTHASVDEVLDRAYERLGPTLSARIKRTVDAIGLSCDPDLLAIALAHLLENALKNSPDSASVTVEAEERGGFTFVRVRDEGIGIGAEHLPYIFERFYRVEPNLVSATGGAGLGLHIVRSIARAHGGSVSVESRPNHGTTMTLRFPVRA